jgi:hypothetical protein
MNDSPERADSPRSPWRQRARVAAAMTGLAGAALLLTACGGGSSSTAAGGSTSYQEAVSYAQCMRSHGVASYPDPNSQGQFPPVQIGRDGVSQQAVQSAQNTCRHLQPGVGTGTSQQEQGKTTQALDFSKCMRAHGVPDFPDPSTSSGGMGYNLSGVDTNSPQYQSANRVCQSQAAKGQSPAGAGS